VSFLVRIQEIVAATMDVLSLSHQETKSLSSLEGIPVDHIAKICRMFLQKLLLGGSSDNLGMYVVFSV
jgi:hypothetical protein